MRRACVFFVVTTLVATVMGCRGPAPAHEYSLFISSGLGGSVTTPGEATFTYPSGTVVDLVAEAEQGYRFASWTGDVHTVFNQDAASTTIIMNGNYSINATFAREVADWHDLHAMRHNPGGTYILTDNLHSGTAGYAERAGPTANDGRGWEPIGAHDPFAPFIGSFDGQGYEVRDLFIDRPDEYSVGLFGVVSEGATISSVGVVSAVVTGGNGVGSLVGDNWGGLVTNSYAAGDVNGNEFVGGLIGMNDLGTVADCHSDGNVNGQSYIGGLVGGHWGGTVRNSYSSGNVTGEDGVGGLVGENHEGAVHRAYATGSVTGSWSTGGLVGESHGGSIVTTYAKGSVTGSVFVGGLLGYNDGLVEMSYSAGSVSGDQHFGGLVGQSGWQGTVSNSFWDIVLSGMDESAGGTGRTTTEMQDIATFSEATWDICAVPPGEIDQACIWNIVDSVTYPFFHWQSLS